MQEHLIQCHKMKEIDNCLSTRNIAAYPKQEEFVIEKSKEAWDRGAHWQEKACMIFSEGNADKLQFIYVVMLCD